MFEKVNPSHPDKVADRIGGAIVDLAYAINDNPKVAVEVLIGHGNCHVIIETDTDIKHEDIEECVHRIGGDVKANIQIVPQDKHLNDNQKGKIRCGDNGIFKGVPVTDEQRMLSEIAHMIYDRFKTDGKYIIDLEKNKLIICQSCVTEDEIKEVIDEYGHKFDEVIINPLGYWTGGTSVDTGATNRKLGSDMGDSVTGGGLSGKELSKADVSINIYAWLLAQHNNKIYEFNCAIGDEYVNDIPYEEMVVVAMAYINSRGGFEKFAEWGLI